MAARKNKTLATLLATSLGGIGVHRFYMHGKTDVWAWVYVAVFILYSCLCFLAKTHQSLYLMAMALFPVSVYASLIEALVIGLTPDEQWDTTHNAAFDRPSASAWQLVVLLVLTLGGGFVAFISSLARAIDLIYTGGAYG